MLSRFRSPPAERLLDCGSHHRVASLAQPELDQFSFQPATSIASRQMRGANRRRELQIFADSQMLIEGIVLRNVTEIALQLIEIGIKRLAIEQNLTAGGL